MSDVNEEMKSTAFFAIKSAKERFGQDLDYSTQSITRLENLLGHIYWGFSNHTKDEGENGVIFNTAIIWGSYLGEYMRLIWGGTWVVKGGVDPVISIDSIEFSPISMVYQKITSQPDYSLEDYLMEAKRIIDSTAVVAKQAPPLQTLPVQAQAVPAKSLQAESIDDISELRAEIPVIQADKPRSFDKRLLFGLAGVGGILLLALAFIIVYKIINAGGTPAYGLVPTLTGSDPAGIGLVVSSTATPTSTDTQTPTVTLPPTYTPRPTDTQTPTNTPNLTETQIAGFTPTETQTPVPATPTRRPTNTRTPTTPTDTHVPSTEIPPSTWTPHPPTNTPVPIVLQSCSVDPNSVQAGFNTPLSFTANFSAPGYGFSAQIQADNPGQSGCSGSDTNNDGTASCDGSSGQLLPATKVNVLFTSSVGDCTASFSSP